MKKSFELRPDPLVDLFVAAPRQIVSGYACVAASRSQSKSLGLAAERPSSTDC
jgi:hypothetical protein